VTISTHEASMGDTSPQERDVDVCAATYLTALAIEDADSNHLKNWGEYAVTEADKVVTTSRAEV
jgi:hypothetical protein